jgi:hypothetical protein
MITAMLLLPVFATLVWLYWYLLPAREWQWIDSIVHFFVISITAVYIRVVSGVDFGDAGPMWRQIVSVAGAYFIVTVGLVSGLAWRRRKP